MFNREGYENSRPGGVGVLEIAPQGKVKPDTTPQFVPLKRSELTGEIAGPLATLRLTHVFGYTRQQSNKVVEAIYRFPLPGDAAVVDVRVQFGEVEIRASLKERQQAEEEYKAAKAQGRQAALATREAVDVFTLQVAGLQPDQDIVIETSYIQLARPEGAGWSLRVPLTTAPRYVRSDEVNSRPAHGQPLGLPRDPGHRFTLDLTLHGAEAVTSQTHSLKVTGEAAKRVQLSEGAVIPDRDFVLVWQPQHEDTRPTLKVLTYRDEVDDWLYFLAQVSPPASLAAETLAREIILLVDRSGSMGGAKWAAAEWAAKSFLTSLTARDRFSLGLFDNVVEWATGGPQAASADVTEIAARFIGERGPRGGTELGVALEQALSQPRTPTTPSRHVLVVTDAQVSDDSRILRLASAESDRPDHRRISVLCIDAAPNAFLASELAERGRGEARFLTSNPDEGDITTALDEMMADWAAPVLSDLRLEVNHNEAQSSRGLTLPGRAFGWRGLDLGDLPTGRSLWAAGRVPVSAAASLTWRLTDANGDVVARQAASQALQLKAGEGIKALFGSRRVLGLEYLMNAGFSGQDLTDQLERLGYTQADLAATPVQQSKLYAENTRADVQQVLRGLLVREALAYGLASTETAFIAVRREANKPVEQTVAVSNALPAGWSEDFLGMPRMAMASMGGGQLSSKRSAMLMNMAPAIPVNAPVARALSLESAPPTPTRQMHVLFKGTPVFQGNEAVLFDSSQPGKANALSKQRTLSVLRVRCVEAPSDPTQLAGITLLLFIEDMTTPRARVRLQDIIRTPDGERPLNISLGERQTMRLVLVDQRGATRMPVPSLEVAVG